MSEKSSFITRTKPTETVDTSFFYDDRPGISLTDIKRCPQSTRAMTVATTYHLSQNHVMAITEGRGVATEVGLCMLHFRSNECTLSQFADSQTYVKSLYHIHLNDPQKILMMSASNNVIGDSKLHQLIEQYFPNITIVTLPRKYFSDETGMTFLKDYGIQEDISSLILGLSTKYYCLAATSAVFRYIMEHSKESYTLHTVKFKYKGAEGTMLIDIITARNLELVVNRDKNYSNDTLYGVLNHTSTSMGTRLLRMSILQPPTDKKTIELRLDVVEELAEKEEMLSAIQSSLSHLTDMDHIISDIIKVPSKQSVRHSEAKINHVIMLKNAIKAIKEISNSLSLSKGLLLTAIQKTLQDPSLDVFSRIIEETLNHDIEFQKTSLGLKNQRCYSVKERFNGLLDVARQTYKETVQDIYDMATEYGEITELPIKLQFNNSKGFYLCISSIDQLSNFTLPPLFINMVEKKKHITFTTLELLKKNFRLEESLTEVYLMSDSIITDLLQQFRANVNVLYKISEAIALLDLLVSFAKHYIDNDCYVRPEFTNTLAIKAGRHPILDKISKNSIVPNDTFASLSSSFQFITGPNMSGKSTYIKQIALIAIMAHMGSFVPAEYASFRLSDQILSRLTNDNTLELNTSSFMSEMRETAYILHNIKDTSLVLIDELGRGTSPQDALSIAGAICEELIQSKAYCFFSTHLHELSQIIDMYPNVVSLQLRVDMVEKNSACSMHYLYTVEDGHSSKYNYGLKTAELVGFPNEIMLRAYEIADQMERDAMWDQKVRVNSSPQRAYQKIILWFADKIIQISQAELTEENLCERLVALKSDLNCHLQGVDDSIHSIEIESQVSSKDDYYTI
ncbi:muts domain V-domain-containing protein [Spinellus fusiger]|nr:muts domain V-domain-containing protein [Spinellus fusiger]